MDARMTSGRLKSNKLSRSEGKIICQQPPHSHICTSAHSHIFFHRKNTFQNSVLLGIAIKKEIGFFCRVFNILMQLMMYIGNDLIEAVPLEDSRIQKPGYIGQFKRNLKIKYRELIQQYSNPPEFLVVDPRPMNQSFSQQASR